ncbi:MAG: serine/threonine-protein kinase PknK, partial [bacterium]|nr:serine/threonine-protein kinase PknK [bacterium]
MRARPLGMIGSSLANRYEITAELGRGGMGVVYRARDPLLRREVAVKVLDVSALSVTSEERFRREAQLVAQMDHPAIVPIYDVGRHESSLFFVMPVVQGTTVHTLIREGSLELGEILEIVAQVAEALDYSHAQGVIHRDVKPENLMVARAEGPSAGNPVGRPSAGHPSAGHPSAGRPRVRVMDFGLARGAASRLTKTGNLPGTLSYLSPEQITATEIDGRSDLYSLGTILYECLVGKPPFSGTRYALLYRIAHEPPPPLAGRGLDKTLEGIVLRCLAKDPADRPQRGNELAALLRSYGEGLDEDGRSEAVAPERSHGGWDQPPLVLPMLGRRREVAELERRLSQALEGECQFVVIAGEAGMGKTRLLQELKSMARNRGILVLRGHFSDQENAFPYQGFGELVQDYCRSREVPPEGDKWGVPPEGDKWGVPPEGDKWEVRRRRA